MEQIGWIKLHRKITDWGWYADPIVKSVFLHILLTANITEKEWLGHTIKRGQTVVSYSGLADTLGITYKQARSAIDKLESTHEITRSRANRFIIVTVENYEIYQCSEQSEGNQKAIKGQSEGNQRAIRGQSEGNQRAIKGQSEGNTIRNKEYKECKEVKNVRSKEYIDTCTEQSFSQEAGNDSASIFIELPLNDGTRHPVYQSEIETFKELYPAVDVEQELRNIKGWLIGNPRKRKTKSGITRFVTSWLSKEQNKGGNNADTGRNHSDSKEPRIRDNLI